MKITHIDNSISYVTGNIKVVKNKEDVTKQKISNEENPKKEKEDN